MLDSNSTAAFTESPLDFEVVKTPLAATMPDGTTSPVDGKVGLTRTDNGETIAVVGERYGLVQNADLFQRIDDEVFAAIGEEHRESAIVKDRVAKGGAMCYRDYAFPRIKMDGDMRGILERGKDGVTDLGFRLLVSNGFGGSSLAVMAGAIDFYCQNGMVLGKLHGAYQVRHTRNVEIHMTGVDKAARDAVDIFQSHGDVFARYVRSPLTDALAKLTLDESLAFSKALVRKIHDQWMREKVVRGANAWALYSAATYYASHFDGAFAARNTGNDHTAATMMARSKKVDALVESDAFKGILR